MMRDNVKHGDLVARWGEAKALELLHHLERMSQMPDVIVHLDKETRWAHALRALNN
jgi:hypothetical protein